MGNCIKIAEEVHEVNEVKSVSQQMNEAPRKTTVPKLKKVVYHRLFERRRTQKEYSQHLNISPYDEGKRSAGYTEPSMTS